MTSPSARVRAFYADYHQRMGNTSGWPDPSDGRRLYAAAAGDPVMVWPDIASVLDVGSGEGHLLPHLRGLGFRGVYLGVELLETCYAAARRLHRDDGDATFVCADFDAYDLGGARFDWVFSLGSLAVRQPDQDRRDRAALARMVEHAAVGIVLYVNDLGRVPPPWLNDLPDLAAHDPAWIAETLAELGCPVRNMRWYDADHSLVIHAMRL